MVAVAECQCGRCGNLHTDEVTFFMVASGQTRHGILLVVGCSDPSTAVEILYSLNQRCFLICEQSYSKRRCNKRVARSEEHTSELQSRENLVCRLLLEKKKKQ